MYNIDDILEKVNAPRARLSEENDTAVTLTDLFSRSFPEVKKITGDSLSWERSAICTVRRSTNRKKTGSPNPVFWPGRIPYW
nr:SepA [Serratia proteamaculans]